MHEFWASLLAVAIGLWLLYRQLGVAFVAPLLVTLLVTSLSSYLGSKVRAGRLLFLRATQARVSFTMGLIKDLRLVKMLGLAAMLQSRTKKLREEEVRAQR